MLYISKWKAAAILLTAFICCLLAVPNFFPESTVKRWPEWAQRHIVLGLDLQGGSHILLEVDANDVRRQKLLALQDDVRRVLREARIGLTRAPVIRGNSVEVIIRESDLQQGLTKLRELSQPLSGFLGSSGQRSLDVENAGGGLVRLTVTEPALLERVRRWSINRLRSSANASTSLASSNHPFNARVMIASWSRCRVSEIRSNCSISSARRRS